MKRLRKSLKNSFLQDDFYDKARKSAPAILDEAFSGVGTTWAETFGHSKWLITYSLRQQIQESTKIGY
jgi:hypothetical protein